MREKFLKPVSDVPLLPCRTHMNLTRQLHANSREWFQTSNLIQSRQIQNKENIAVSHSKVKTLEHIDFHKL